MLKELISGLNSNKEEEFYVGEGAIVMRNACIPLSAISELELSSPKFSLMPQIAFIIIGFVLFWAKNSVFKIIGELLLFVGVIELLLMFVAIYFRQSSLHIFLNSGRCVTFSSKDEAFVRELMEILRKKLQEPQGVIFVDMSKKVIQQNVDGIQIDKLINHGISIIGNGNTIPKNKIYGDGANTNEERVVNKGLTEEEWKLLSFYLQKRCRELSESSQEYKICRIILQDTKQREEVKVKEKLRKLADKKAIGQVLGTALGATISEIIKKLLS